MSAFSIKINVTINCIYFQFIIKWKEKYAVVTWCENVKNKEKKKMWRRKDRKSTDAFFYPWKEVNT